MWKNDIYRNTYRYFSVVNFLGNAVDALLGEQCYVGKYCEQGATAMQDCPSGTFGNLKGATSVDDCV